jgi:acyl-CoA thioesterase-1
MKTHIVFLILLFFFNFGIAADGQVPVNDIKNSTKESKQEPKRLLILGDSLTEGYGVQKNQAYPMQLQKIFDEKNINIKVISAGISGSTSASAIKRLQWHLRAKPDFMILALGGNDGLRGLKIESTKDNLNQTIKLAQAKGVKVFLAGMKIPTNYGDDYTQNFEKLFIKLSKENKIKLIPFLLKDVAGLKDLNLEDQIHPNEKGHQLIAKTVYDSIKEDL